MLIVPLPVTSGSRGTRFSKINLLFSVLPRTTGALPGSAICSPESCFVTTVGMLESDYIHAASPKPPPPIPVRVFLRSQLTAALRQHARPIVIEDQELARPFTRLLRARQLRLWALSSLIVRTNSWAAGQNAEHDRDRRCCGLG